MKISLREKLNFVKIALSKHYGLLIGLLVFVILGASLVCIGIMTNATVLSIFGGIFVIFPLIIIGATLPSSLSHYYQNQVTRKYGTYSTAIIFERQILDISHKSEFYNRYTEIEEYLYSFTYKYEYKGVMYESSFLSENKDIYDALIQGSEIPIQFLRNNPSKSRVRTRKLSNQLGLPIDFIKEMI